MKRAITSPKLTSEQIEEMTRVVPGAKLLIS